MLSEINHTEKDKYLFTTYMVNKKKKNRKQAHRYKEEIGDFQTSTDKG